MQKSSCTCPGSTVVYQCTVRGHGSTVWQGTAFHCSDSDGSLTLHHIRSTFVNHTDECTDGQGTVAVAQGVGIIENSTAVYYTSQLKLTVGPDTDNKTVQCAHDNENQVNIVGTITIEITTGGSL